MRQFSYLIISRYVRTLADITTKQYYKVLKVSDFLARVPSPESRHPSPVSGGRSPFRCPSLVSGGRSPFRFAQEGWIIMKIISWTKRIDLWARKATFLTSPEGRIYSNFVLGHPVGAIASLLKTGLTENPFEKRFDRKTLKQRRNQSAQRLWHNPFQKRLDRKPEKYLSLITLSPNHIGVITTLFKKGLTENHC